MARRLQAAAQRDAPGLELLHARAVAALLIPGSAGAVQQAVRDLEATRIADPHSAAVLSDLSAAYLVRAGVTQDPRDLVRALGRAILSRQRDATLPEAAFNKALAAERLGLTSTAAWRDYLRLDNQSPWADEAREHLAALGNTAKESRWLPARAQLVDAARRSLRATVEQVVSKFPRGARLYVEEDLLPAWGRAWRAGDARGGADLLTEARVIAEAIAKISHDALLADSVHQIDALLRAERLNDVGSLAEGFVAYGEAHRLRREDSITAADERFEVSERWLAAAGSPFAWPNLYRGITEYTLQDYDSALQRLDDLLARRDGAHYPNLAGRAWWVMGLCRVALAQPAEAIAAYRASLSRFEHSGETESAIAIEGLIADALRYIGDEPNGWRYRYAALAGSYKLQDPRRRHVILGDAAQAAEQLGEPDSALLLLDEALRLVARTNNPLDLAEALRARAAIELRHHQERAAVETLHQARRYLARLHEPNLEKAVLAEILQVEGQLQLRQEPQRSLSSLSAAAELFRQTRYVSRLADSYLDQAQAELAAGRREDAEQRLWSAVSVVEMEWEGTMAHRGDPVVDDFGPGYPDRRRRVFDALLSLLAEKDPAIAFDFAERSHGWDLIVEALELPSRRVEAPALQAMRSLTHEALQRQLPADTVVVEFALLPDRLLAWAMTREQLRMAVTPLGKDAVAHRVEQFYSALRRRDRGELRASLETLHEILLHPLREVTAGRTQLVIVPDGCLAALPFAALRDRRSGRRVILDHSVAVAPSTTLFVGARQLQRPLELDRGAGALVIGDPEFDRTLFPDSQPLPSAAVEAARVAALYPGSVVLIGREATKRRFLDLASMYPIVHFAGHARSQNAPALISSLLLASSRQPGDPGVLYAYELLQHTFAHTQLFVLSACETSGGGSRRIAGFVRPLLATGVPSVVASLWLVEDEAAADLMASFHQRYQQTGDAPAALRAAQLAAIAKSADDDLAVFSWGVFQAFGATGGRQP